MAAPRALTHTPMRSSRSAPATMTSANPNTVAADAGVAVAAMITDENSTNEASSNRTAAAPTRQGPGR